MPVNFRNLGIHRTITPAERAKANLSNLLRDQMRVDGVFEGGGALGTAYVGALRALHDNGIWFARVAGNSAGAITASMIAAGFTAPEIQWLSSAFSGGPPVPGSLSSLGITSPIGFANFLDLPTLSSVSQTNKRKTMLWKALKGTIIDELGKTKIPVPIQNDAVNACVQGILGVPLLGNAIRAITGATGEAALRTALNTALAPLPNSQLHIKDFLPNTESLRIQLADTLWDVIARNIPLMLMMTNFVHEGSFFEGDVFLRTTKELLGRKVHNNPKATVLFSDLKIPLAVIASNIDTGEMQVYDSNHNGNMEVAEAVRRSMSIPFTFQPRGGRKQFVDGGIFSNFPLWLFSDGGQSHWPQSSVDDNRVKVGFSLNEFKQADSQWNVQPARFQVSGNPPRVDQREVVKPILEDKLIQLGYPQAVVALQLAEAFGVNSGSANANQEPEIEILQQVLGVVFRGVLNTEESTRRVITEGLMKGRPYVDVTIPLLGFDGFDFYVNQDESALLAMWDRGWHAAIGPLIDAKQRGIMPPVMRVSTTQTPFN